MRLQFGIDDEDAAIRAREELVDRFGAWLGGQQGEPAADQWDVSLMLDWKWSYADGDYATWTRADVDELLLEHLPRKLSAPPDLAASFPASIGSFAHFLEDEGLLGPQSDPAEVIAARAQAQARAFLDAMEDPSRFGMAKRLFMGADLTGDELPSQEALAEAMEAFNALPFEERGRLLGLDDEAGEGPDEELPRLPLREAPDAEQLAALAAEVPLLRRVDALHEALGPDGIKLTKAGNPTVADGRRLADTLGVDRNVRDIRSSAELSELFAVSQVAQLAGAAFVDGNRLRAGAGWARLSAVERWEAVVDAVFEAGAATLRFGATEPMPLQFAHVADAATPHYLALMWLEDEPVPIEVLVGVLEELTSFAPGQWPGLSKALGADIARARVDDVLASLADAGVVQVGPAVASLTAAGPALVATPLSDMGFDVLRPAEVAAMSVGDIVDLVGERGDDPATVLRLWSAGRAPGKVAELIVDDLVADPGPVRVLTGLALLDCLGPDAHGPLLRARDSAIGPQAWMFLASAGVVADTDVPREVVIEAGLNLYLGMADAGSPADVIESMLQGQSVAEQQGFIDELARTAHPRAGDLLELIGRHHPDRAVAKHARKAAHRWRSGQGPRRA